MSFDDMAHQQERWDARARAAQGAAARAYARLLKLAETRDSGQIRRVAQFLTCSASYNGQAFPVDLYELPRQRGTVWLVCRDLDRGSRLNFAGPTSCPRLLWR
jgi:hypothetical protein